MQPVVWLMDDVEHTEVDRQWWWEVIGLMGWREWKLEAAAVCQSYGAWGGLESRAACSQDLGHPGRARWRDR